MESDHEASMKELQDLVRKIPGPIFESESYLQILLQANRMNLRKSKEAVKEIVSWRNKHGLDSLKSEDFTLQFEYDIGLLTGGTTPSGVPCFYIHARFSRFSRIFKQFGYDKYVQYTAWKLSQVEKDVLHPTATNDVKRCALDAYAVPLICDGAGFTFSNVPSFKDMWNVLHSCRELYNHFPVFSSTVAVFINVNKWLELSLKIAKPFLEATGFKVVIHGTNEDKWSKYMDELVGMEQLRRFQSMAEEYSYLSKQLEDNG